MNSILFSLFFEKTHVGCPRSANAWAVLAWAQVLTDEEEALERYKVVIHAMQVDTARRSDM